MIFPGTTAIFGRKHRKAMGGQSGGELVGGHEEPLIYPAPNMMWFVGQFFLIPVATMAYGIDLLVLTMHEMQKTTTQGIDSMWGIAPPMTANQGEPFAGEVTQTSDSKPPKNGSAVSEAVPKEDGPLSNDGGVNGLDKDLRDDMLKLVRYKILFVKREYEHAFPEKEDLVSDNMDGAAFTAWKVAEFIQSLQGHGDPVKVPAKWVEKGYPEPPYAKGGNLTGLPDWDKKYLRVYYEVLERYPREKFKYEEQQIRVLEQIRDKMTVQAAPSSPPKNP